ncbi:MAG: hypothetical protein V8T36_02855 [Ruthenibacterium lactatiformans]
MTSRRAAGLLPPSARRFIFCVLTETTANSLMAKNALEAMSMTCRNKLGRTVSIKTEAALWAAGRLEGAAKAGPGG